MSQMLVNVTNSKLNFSCAISFNSEFFPWSLIIFNFILRQSFCSCSCGFTFAHLFFAAVIIFFWAAALILQRVLFAGFESVELYQMIQVILKVPLQDLQFSL